MSVDENEKKGFLFLFSNFNLFTKGVSIRYTQGHVFHNSKSARWEKMTLSHSQIITTLVN